MDAPTSSLSARTEVPMIAIDEAQRLAQEYVQRRGPLGSDTVILSDRTVEKPYGLLCRKLHF
jgi:hypothetical protein